MQKKCIFVVEKSESLRKHLKVFRLFSFICSPFLLFQKSCAVFVCKTSSGDPMMWYIICSMLVHRRKNWRKKWEKQNKQKCNSFFFQKCIMTKEGNRHYNSILSNRFTCYCQFLPKSHTHRRTTSENLICSLTNFIWNNIFYLKSTWSTSNYPL